MNEKEIEKVETRCWDIFKDEIDADSLSDVCDFVGYEVKEAYHKGYMAGTMEAL